MKKFRFFAILLAMLLLLGAFGLLAACAEDPDPNPDGGDPNTPDTPSTGTEKTQYGDPAIFDEYLGYYTSEASVVQAEDGTRYVFYTSNETEYIQENVIAMRVGTRGSDGGSTYGDKQIVLRATAGGWDAYNLGAPDVVEGSFAYNGTTYNYLMAYQATSTANETAYSIGFAVAASLTGEWVKVGTEPVVEYDAAIYGNYVGYYSPSLIANTETNVRLFYTWADAYGHYTYFNDIDCTDMADLGVSGYAMLPSDGLTSNESAVPTQFANGDFAYDAATERLYVVKDVSPAAAARPYTATQIELAWIDVNELYTAAAGDGWQSLKVFTYTDTIGVYNGGGWERIYSPALVSATDGSVLSAETFDIVYTASDLASLNEYYVFSPSLHPLTYTVAASA